MMKVSDLVNVLHHIPGNLEVDDFTLHFADGSIKASHAVANLQAGKSLLDGATMHKPEPPHGKHK